MRVLRALATLAGVIAFAVLLVAGPGTRFGLWNFRTGLLLLRYAAYLGIGAIGLCVIALVASRPRGGPLAALLLALLLAVPAVVVPWEFNRRAKRVPPIHDISTDTQDPPQFIAVLPLRKDALNSATYGGDSVATLQQSAYPDIKPVKLRMSPAQAFDRALAVAKGMGWTIAAADPSTGRIEATATTVWFGFKDDVVVRVRPDGAGSRVDVRSESRVGKSDIGTNAARVRAFISKIAAAPA